MPEEKIEETTLTSEEENLSDSFSSCTSTSHCSEESPHSNNVPVPVKYYLKLCTSFDQISHFIFFIGST